MRGGHRPQRYRRQADGAAAAAPRCHGDHLPLANRAICRGRPRRADIVVVARSDAPGFVTREFIKPGATVIDVGINVLTELRATSSASLRLRAAKQRTFAQEGRVLVGDVHPEVAEVAGALTPVPGGVGPLTIAMVLRNTIAAGGTCASTDPMRRSR